MTTGSPVAAAARVALKARGCRWALRRRRPGRGGGLVRELADYVTYHGRRAEFGGVTGTSTAWLLPPPSG